MIYKLKTKGDINRLGEKIRVEFPDIKNETKEQIQEHRISFKEITNTIFNELSSLSRRVNKNSIITYRIKRIETIIGKLQRLDKKQKFARMWDISGCRCILDNDREVYKLEKLIAKKFIIRKKNDYIKYPKENGYKSLHLYLQKEENGKIVELQIRNRIDHNWATLVEITDLIFDSDLKEKGRDKKLEKFLFLLSKKKNLNVKDKILIAKVVKEYKYFEKLSEVFTRNYLKVRNRWFELETLYSHKFFLIETKKNDIPKIDSFLMFNKAESEYFKRYLKNQDSNIVLTHLLKPSYKNISSAYSNYILTVHSVLDDIIEILQELIIDSIKVKKYFSFLKYYNLYLSVLYDHVNNIKSEILVSKSIKPDSSQKLIKQKEWEEDIEKQVTKITRNNKKLQSEIDKYAGFSKYTSYIINALIKRIEKKNAKKIKVY